MSTTTQTNALGSTPGASRTSPTETEIRNTLVKALAEVKGESQMSYDTEREETMTSAREERDSLSQRLKEAREYLGLSQEFVADQLGIPRASLSAMETGRRKVSSLELKQLARLYKQSVQYFYGEDEALPQAQPKDEAMLAIFRTTKDLTVEDRQQVLRFAQFLRASGPAPKPKDADITRS
jgi:transcriptional regulator with XRE-family HTH domain